MGMGVVLIINIASDSPNAAWLTPVELLHCDSRSVNWGHSGIRVKPRDSTPKF